MWTTSPFSPPFENVKSVKVSIKTSITLHFMLDYMLLSKASKSPKAFDKSELQTSVTTKNNKASD